MLSAADRLSVKPGPHNGLPDVAGIGVGHVSLEEEGWLTGTTVVLAPPAGAVAGVDVRGGAPGTRETDLLDPTCLIDRVHAIALSGGSAFGLATCDGVVAQLFASGVGWAMGPPDSGEVVPIVPGAVIFDLGRGGVFANHPQREDGRLAVLAGLRADGVSASAPGRIGAGTGARAGSLAGGVGSASAVLPDGTTVAAIVVVNSAGSPVHPVTGDLLATAWGIGVEFGALRTPQPSEVAAYRALRRSDAEVAGMLPGTATTIGVLATDATLTKGQCRKLAGVGHDGIARAISPAHTLLDGDTLFALATGERPEPTMPDLFALHDAAAGCVTRAIGHAMLASTSVTMWPGSERQAWVACYREAFSTAFTT